MWRLHKMALTLSPTIECNQWISIIVCKVLLFTNEVLVKICKPGGSGTVGQGRGRGYPVLVLVVGGRVGLPCPVLAWGQGVRGRIGVLASLPPSPVDWQTNWKKLPSLVLRSRAVKTELSECSVLSTNYNIKNISWKVIPRQRSQIHQKFVHYGCCVVSLCSTITVRKMRNQNEFAQAISRVSSYSVIKLSPIHPSKICKICKMRWIL